MAKVEKATGASQRKGEKKEQIKKMLNVETYKKKNGNYGLKRYFTNDEQIGRKW